MNEIWSVREYRKTDEPMIADWWDYRNNFPFPFALLPPLGIIAELNGEPSACCWLYMAVNVGVCWIEHAISRPKLSFRQSRTAFGLVVGTLEAAAKDNDYGYMIAHASTPVTRVLKGFGFLDTNDHHTNSVAKLLCLPQHS